MQGYSREAEGEAQPVQEADLVAQQMSCQQQSADFLRAEKQEGEVIGGMSWPLCKEGQALSTTTGESQTRPNSQARAAGLQGTEKLAWGLLICFPPLCYGDETKEMLSQNCQDKRRPTKCSCVHRNKGEPFWKVQVGSPQLPGENAASYRALWDMHWSRGSSHTMAANGTVK